LPGLRIERTQIVGKIRVEEHPGAADLGTRNLSYLRALTQFLRMYLEERGCLQEGEGTHG